MLGNSSVPTILIEQVITILFDRDDMEMMLNRIIPEVNYITVLIMRHPFLKLLLNFCYRDCHIDIPARARMTWCVQLSLID